MALGTDDRCCLNLPVICIICLCSLSGDTQVMYHKFDISASSPPDSDSDYSCAVATASGQWRISRCHDRHFVVCQSDHLLPGSLHRLIGIALKSS